MLEELQYILCANMMEACHKDCILDGTHTVVSIRPLQEKALTPDCIVCVVKLFGVLLFFLTRTKRCVFYTNSTYRKVRQRGPKRYALRPMGPRVHGTTCLLFLSIPHGSKLVI